MKRLSRTIWSFLLLLPILSACGKDGVIPRDEMSQIYAEMFLRDEWLDDHHEARSAADTSLVYESIFQKYGYDSEDYNTSIAYYMKDPDRFARILRKTNVLLEQRIKELRRELEIQNAMKLKKEEMLKFKVEYEMFYDRIGSPDSIARGDTFVYYLDTNVLVFDYNPELRFDTLYIGPELIFPSDTVPPSDSSDFPADSLGIAADSLHRAGKLKLGDSLMVKKVKAIRQKNLNGKLRTVGTASQTR